MARHRWNTCYKHVEHAIWILACFLLLQSLLSTTQHQDNEEPQNEPLRPITTNRTNHLLYINSIGKAKVKANAPGFVPEETQQEPFWKGAKIDIQTVITDTRAKRNQCDVELPPQPSKADCSFKLFKMFFRTCGYFPDQGIWRHPEGQFPKPAFELEFCNLPSPSRTIPDIQKIFLEQRIKNVVTVGNSHALNYHIGIRRVMAAGGYECLSKKTNRTRRFSSNGRYHAKCQPNLNFTQSAKDGNLEERPMDRAPRKTVDDDSSVHIHHYGVNSLGDRALQCMNPNCATETEYIFKHKLRQTQVDILIIAPTFNLDKHTHFEIVYEQLKSTIAMVEKLGVKKVIWLTNPSEAPKKCPDFSIETFEFDLDGNGKINGLNHLLYQLLKPMLEDLDQDVFSLMDLFSISLSLQEKWNTNCVAYKKKWYMYMVSVIFGMLEQKE